VGKKEPSYSSPGNASWCNHSGKKLLFLFMFKNLNIDLPYDPANPLLEIYPKNASQVTPKAPARPSLLQCYSQ
jgi:hypothetical protein